MTISVPLIAAIFAISLVLTMVGLGGGLTAHTDINDNHTALFLLQLLLQEEYFFSLGV